MYYLFNRINDIKSKLKGKYLFIFLDYDGTLAPIANSPEEAVISERTRGLLERLAGSSRCKVAVISGRSLNDIKSRLGLKNIIYSGNHGLEIEGPKIKFITLVPSGYRQLICRIKSDLSNKISSIKGALIEDKGLSLTLHYRLVKRKDIVLLKTIFHETIIYDLVSNRIKIKAGKKVLEVRPIVEWDKGKVVLWLFARQEFAKAKSKILPIYIGDDLTDEDAFKALEHIGLTVFVGSPGHSRAHYYLKNTAEVGDFLARILNLFGGG